MTNDPIFCAKCRRSWPRRLWYVAIEKVMRIGDDGKPEGPERVLRCRTCRSLVSVPV